MLHKNITIVNNRPSVKDLYRHFTPNYATKWRIIGKQLGLNDERLKIIAHDNFYKAELCCNAMLSSWLQMDTTASWGKLFDAIEQEESSSSAPDKGN